MAFDVEKTMRPLPPSGDPAYKPLKAAIKSVNLMTYLLGNVTYFQLYREPFGKALDSIVSRANALVSDPTLADLKRGAFSKGDISGDLRRELVAIQGIPGIENLILGNLFVARASSPAETQLVNALRGMYSNSLNSSNECELAHFCCPFLYRQEANVDLLDKGILDIFLDYIGNKTMYDLYTEPRSRYSDAQKYILTEARLTHYILGDKSSRPGNPYPPRVSGIDPTGENGGAGPMSNPFGNFSKCVNGSCTNSPNATDWCNDANGSCSAASNP